MPINRPDLRTINCPECGGTGKIPDPQANIGSQLVLEREERGVNRKELSQFFMKGNGLSNYSESYITDLERGARPLTWELIEKYRKAIDKAVSARLEVASET